MKTVPHALANDSGLQDAALLRRHPYDGSLYFRTKLTMMRSGFRNWRWPSTLLLGAWSAGRGPWPLRLIWDLPVTLRTREGPALRARLRDVPGPGDVFGLSEYDFDGIDWAQIHHVIDAGAHIGAFTVWVASRAPCQVLALEPNPETFALLEQNVGRAELQERVKLHNVALAARRGLRTLQRTRYSTAASLVPAGGSGHGLLVGAITLEDAIASSGFPQVDLLKIDIEGAEYEVFEEMAPAMLDRVNALIIECHYGPGWDHGAVIDLLRRSRFRVAVEVKPDYALLIASRPA